MSLDPDAIATKRDTAALFTRSFLRGYLAPAFGARSKYETDLLVFSCLVEAKAIDPDGPIYDIARGLNISPTRARTLVLNWQLRTTANLGDMKSAIVAALKKTRFSTNGTLMTFGVESPLLKEEIMARLRSAGVFTDTSFSRELVRMPVDAFVEFLDTVVDDETKKAIKTVLVKDKQLPDRSFKALATGILKKLGEKVADEAGGEIAKVAVGKASGFLSGILSGDLKGAVKGITADDYKEA
jgi:hypothetical protein